MKKSCRIIALMLAMLMMLSSLVSCDILQGIINGSGSSDSGSNNDNTDNTPTPHVCESKCHKCQKCKDESCTEDICKNKCQGHGSTVIPAHTCESVCEECGKCKDEACTETVCAEKCGGHEEPNPTHSCESVCEECGKCQDEACIEDACTDKCEGHSASDQKEEAYGYLPVISEQMPVIYINTPDGSNEWATKYVRNDKLAGNIDYVDATISTGNCDAEYEISNAVAEVKVRGNYTLDYAKKPIRIKFSKSDKSNLFGLHDGEKYRNWVLLADWKDLSMSNNTVAFYLGNTILGSDGYYCTDFRNVEVYLNGVYWGVYLLVEQQEVKDGRTSVSEVEDDYTGNDIGYFFEYDGYYDIEASMPDGDPTFTMNHQGLPSGSQGYTVKSDIYADSQLQFLKNYMNNVFYIAYQANYNNTFYKFNDDYSGVVLAPEYTSAEEAVSAVIDLKSLVGTYILNEIARDLDVDWSSFYLSLDMSAEGNKKVTFEAPWDFDSCFGIISRENCSDPTGLYAATNANPWFQLVVNEDWFWDMVHDKWAEMKEYKVLDNVIELVKTEKEVYKDYYIKNYTKWSSRVTDGNGEVIWQLNSYKDINTAQGLAADYLIDWLTKRFAYLDSQWTVIEVDENLPENSEVYRYEAEDAALANFRSGSPIRTDRSYASNNSYVGDVCQGSTFTFTVNAKEATTAYLFAGVSKLNYSAQFGNWFSVTVNGETLLFPARDVPAISGSEENWHTFIGIKLAPIELQAGENVIIFTTLVDTTNFDYIDIYSAVEIN